MVKIFHVLNFHPRKAADEIFLIANFSQTTICTYYWYSIIIYAIFFGAV